MKSLSYKLKNRVIKKGKRNTKEIQLKNAVLFV